MPHRKESTSFLSADRVVVMKNGICVECGSPEQLSNLNGEFSRLKSMQIWNE